MGLKLWPYNRVRLACVMCDRGELDCAHRFRTVFHSKLKTFHAGVDNE